MRSNHAMSMAFQERMAEAGRESISDPVLTGDAVRGEFHADGRLLTAIAEGSLWAVDPSQSPTGQMDGGAFGLALEFSVDRESSRPSTLLAIARGEDSVLRVWVGSEASPLDIAAELVTGKAVWRVQAPLGIVPPSPSHLLVLRYTTRRFDLYVDGLFLHLHGSASGTVDWSDAGLKLTGGCTPEDAGADGEHRVLAMSLWNRELSDGEIEALNGGAECIAGRCTEMTRLLEQERIADEGIARNDPNRPRHHLLPPVYWMNDPNGMIHHRGRWRVFYQHNPYGPYWGPMHWGHAESADLIRWSHRPVALEPTPNGPDAEGCFSGCAIQRDGKPVIFYTGVYPEVQCLAECDDEMRLLAKHGDNPIIPGPPEGIDCTGFRDPWVWRHEDGSWRMIVGSGIRDAGGFLPLYRSDDLISWRYMHAFLEGSADRGEHVWECPGVFPLGDRHVLIFSPEPLGKSVYMIGRIVEERFVPESEGLLDVGGNFYAPQTAADGRGRRVMLGWLWEERADAEQWRHRWAGVMSFPRVLGLDEKGRLTMAPAGEVEALRGAEEHLNPGVLKEGGKPVYTETVRCNEVEVGIEALNEGNGLLKLGLLGSPDGEEETALRYDWASATLSLDRSHSSGSEFVHRGERTAIHRLDDGEPLCLRVFVDRSVIEVFANDRLCLSSRVYPAREDSAEIHVSAERGAVRLARFAAWELSQPAP